MLFCTQERVNAQSSPVHHNIQDNATSAVERIAKFSVSDAPDVLEIVNATQFTGMFKPSLWAHSSSDNREVFRIHTTLPSTVDNGSKPVMIFVSELRNTIYDSYPYPWGTHLAEVQNRPLFAWKNSLSTKMLMKANGYLGIGTTSPTAQLHTTSTVRFQNLGSSSSNYFLVVDSNGNVRRRYVSNIGGGDRCLCPYLKSAPNSDGKFKKDIKDIDNPISKVLQLAGKEYNWNTSEYKSMNFDNKLQLGFIAEEVQKVVPELVDIDENGNRSLNYAGMIPLLVEAVKEQQNQIVLLQNKISDLESNKNDDIGIDNLNSNKTSFSSNYPNPFDSKTKVDFFIESNIKRARLVIYDLNGNTVKTMNINERGVKTNLSIDKENLKSGIYFYTLIADDIVIGTKKMLVK